ncbi:hypothetical protein JCM1840_005324 [Sporobolomyces johnsonii]
MNRRADKAQLMQTSRLVARRETREVEDAKAVIAQLEKRVQDLEAEQAHDGNGGGLKASKAMEKEMTSMEKQAQELRTVAEARDSLHTQLTEARAALDSDARVLEVKEDLKSARTQVGKLEVELKMLDEEANIYRTRVRQFEHGAESVGEMDRTKEKEFTTRIAGMEKMIVRLERDKTKLADQLRSSELEMDRVEQTNELINSRLEQEKQWWETECARLEREVTELDREVAELNRAKEREVRKIATEVERVKREKRAVEIGLEIERREKKRERSEKMVERWNHDQTVARLESRLAEYERRCCIS